MALKNPRVRAPRQSPGAALKKGDVLAAAKPITSTTWSEVRATLGPTTVPVRVLRQAAAKAVAKWISASAPSRGKKLAAHHRKN